MAATHAQIPNWRNELTPNIVDHLANVTPTSPYALYPRSPTTYEEGYQTVTYKDFANAINALTWWLHETLGPSTNSEVLAYIGPNDIRYNALLIGAMKTGYVVYLASFDDDHSVLTKLHRLSFHPRATALPPTELFSRRRNVTPC